MIAKSLSSLALILLLFISVCSAQRTVGYYDSPYIHSTSRAGRPSGRPTKRPTAQAPTRSTSPTVPRPARSTSPTAPNPAHSTSPAAGNPTSPNAGGPTSRPSTAPSNQPQSSQGQLPDIDYTLKDKAIAVWGANADLSKGSGVKRGARRKIPGFRKMQLELLAAGRPKTEATRCHMIAQSLGGQGEPNNLFACFQYFNDKAMGYFESLMRDRIPKLQGQDKCKMAVTALFTADKQYPTSVNMDANCTGSQFFNVTISNKLLENEVKINHECIPTVALGPPRFRGSATVVSGASAC